MSEGFLWGAATSSHQIEGHNERNDWWAWEFQGHVEGGARSGAATDHWNRFKEDLRLAREIGLNSYRFSVEWSRLEPEEGKIGEEAYERYAEMIAECERIGLLPMLTLHHFTSPFWLAEKGGFAWDGSADCFGRFAREVARRLGPRVPLWCTINEPMVLAAGTYLGTFMPPARHSPEDAAQACRNLLRCHVRAYDILHATAREIEREGPWRDRPLEAGIAHNMLDFMPDRAWHPIEVILSSVFTRFYNRAWLDAITGRKQNFGVPGIVPRPEPVPEALGRRTADFIGLNYYTKAYAQWRPRAPAQERPGQLPIGLEFGRRKDTLSDVGWAVHPEGFRRTLRQASRYGLPIYVTENGIADREDRHRAEYLSTHLRVLSEERARGVEVRGYYHWSLLDNFEWIKGFGPRFGLYQVDYETFARTPRPSIETFKEWIRNEKN